MSDNQKNINPDNLSRVNGAFKDLSGELETNASDLIESSATEKMQNASDELKKLSKEMKDTIESLDKFLCDVGDTFRNADESMANSISQTIYAKAPATISERHYRQKMAETHDSRFNDFPK